MSHLVTCLYCNERFDRDKQPAVLVGSRRYAHESCYNREKEKNEKEEKDKLALDDYISKHICPEGYVTPRVRKQINHYIREYNYTYSGMLKALIYFYEIQGNSYEKSNGGIGIVPYTYTNAYNYYFAIWLANNNNMNLNIKDYNTKIETVKIKAPKRNANKKKMFSFEEEETI